MAIAALDWSDELPPELGGGAVTVGNFDGVHLGHRALVAATTLWAERANGPAVAVTFDPPPYQVLFPAAPIRPPLTTISQRCELLRAAGAKHVVVLQTSPELLSLSPQTFFSTILTGRFRAAAIVEGYNFRFGHNRLGDTAALRTFCEIARIGFDEVAPLTVDGEVVSSSRVRAAIEAGAVALARDLLGRPYRIAGSVVVGSRRGRTLGFPTANLGDVPTVVPGNGVYAVRATVDGATWPGAANVGPNPTFGEDARKIEVHLIGFGGDLYGRSIAVDFVDRLRETRPFRGAEDLREQLVEDIRAARFALEAS